MELAILQSGNLNPRAVVLNHAKDVLVHAIRMVFKAAVKEHQIEAFMRLLLLRPGFELEALHLQQPALAVESPRKRQD